MTVKETIEMYKGQYDLVEIYVGDGLNTDSCDYYDPEQGLDYKACPADVLERIIGLSQQFKLEVVAQDPRESSSRRLLNLGHSFGHALESASGMLHGYAVSLGIALATGYACAKGRIKEAEKGRILRLLSSTASR